MRTILVVANLSRFAQPVELDLKKYSRVHARSRCSAEPSSRSSAKAYYPLTLGPNSFFWFSLEMRAVPTGVSAVPSVSTAIPELVSVSVGGADIWDDVNLVPIAQALRGFLVSRAWFRSKDRRFRSLSIDEVIRINSRFVILIVLADFTSGDPETYQLPVAAVAGEEADAVRQRHPEMLILELQLPGGARTVLYDATVNGEFNTALLDAFARRKRFQGRSGTLTAIRNREFRSVWGESHPNLEPSLFPNSEIDTSIRFGNRFVLKLLRPVEAGVHPGVEMGRYLTEDKHFPHAAQYAGHLEYQNNNGSISVFGVVHGFVENTGDGWTLTRSHLREYLQRVKDANLSRESLQQSAPINIYDLNFALAEPPQLARDLIGPFLDITSNIGRRIAELHRVLMQGKDPAFAPEPFNDFYRQSLYHANIALTSRRLEFLRQRQSDLLPEVRNLAASVLDNEQAIVNMFKAVFEKRVPSERIRFHERLHLGHILLTDANEPVFFDFEGDPYLHMSERRIKRCPLRDLVSLLLSFGYAAQSVSRQLVSESSEHPVDRPLLRVWTRFWYSHVSAALIRGYFKAAAGAPYLPPAIPEQQILLQNYLMERALLDVRPDIIEKSNFAGMPFRVILHLLDAQAERHIEA